MAVKAVTTKTTFDSRKYGRLLTRTQPVVIKTEAKYGRIDAEIGSLLKKATSDSRRKNAPCSTLTSPIEDYDAEYETFPRSAHHEILQTLLEQNDLTATDLLPIFKSRGYVSEILNGKRARQQTHRQSPGRTLFGLGEPVSVKACAPVRSERC